MSPARRGKVWWSLGAFVALAVLIIAYFSGVLPVGKAKEEKKALCWVSPQNPSYIKEAPGKDPEGHELVPVYATPAGEKPGGPAVAAAATKRSAKSNIGSAPMDPKYIRDKPGKITWAWTWCRSMKKPRLRLRRHPLRPGPGRQKRAQGQVLGRSDGSELCPQQAGEGPLRHGPGAGL